MKALTKFNGKLVAPCGLYCGACYAYLRDKNKCFGCRVDFETKPAYCLKCKIANCEILAKSSSGFCYLCEKFPCQRLKQLDKRYRIKYNTSLIQNLIFIKENGIDKFLENEKIIRTCRDCGSIISIHWKTCKSCT